jgi:ribonuclease J
MTRDIHLLKARFLASREGLDPALDPAILVYEEQKASESTADRTILATYQGKLTNSVQVSKDQDHFILCFSYWDINELIEIEPTAGSVYIYSSSEAYDEEQCADMARLRNWLHHFGITPLGVPDPETGKPVAGETDFHSSGHASAPDLLEIVRIINPKVLVPIHTELPQFFAENCGRDRTVLIPQALQSFAV